MKTKNLFFATNRNHKGSDRWNPTGYGKYFSSDGEQNLRFGKLSIEYDESKVDTYLNNESEPGRKGDGVGLSDYLTGAAKEAKIKAYKDETDKAKAVLEMDQNSSTQFFNDLKKVMMDSSDVVVYIHGYSVSWKAAVAGALALEFMLNAGKSRDDKKITVVLFSWPSNGSKLPFAAYKSDRTDSRNSGKAVGRALLKLRDYLATLKRDANDDKTKLCNQEMHLVCHSMGNYLLQKAVETKMIGYSRGGNLTRMFKHIFLCAPDVNDNVLEPGQGMGRLHEMTGNVTVYYNNGDLAMYISDYTKNESDRLGQVGSSRPALIHNKVHQVDCSPIVKGLTEHSYYLWGTVNKDIRQSIMGLRFDNPERNRKRDGQSREWTMT